MRGQLTKHTYADGIRANVSLGPNYSTKTNSV